MRDARRNYESPWDNLVIEHEKAYQINFPAKDWKIIRQ